MEVEKLPPEQPIKNDTKSVEHPIVRLQLGKKHFLSRRFIPTQYFYSFKKSKIYFKVILEEGELIYPLSFSVRNCNSKSPHELRIQVNKDIKFVIKNGEKECLSNDFIECRFPLPDVYYLETSTYQYSKEFPEPIIYTNDIETITSRIEESIFGDKLLVIVQDYFSYKVTQLTVWLTVLTGILIIKDLFPILIDLIKSIKK